MIQFKKVLCPVDFFQPSSQAFEYAVRLGGNYGARVHALHVIPPVITSAYGAPFAPDDFIADMQKESKSLLEKLKTKAGKDGMITTEVVIGDVDSAILISIQKQGADLVVMGTHGRRGFERLAMGSTTERLIRRSPVPLIVLGHARKLVAPPEVKRILVTTDFSAGTADAMEYALSLAQESQARVTLLHVLNDVAVEVIGRYRHALVHGVEKELQKLVPESALDWCDVETRIEVGEPAVLIPKIAKTGKFDLLVMNIHGKGFLDRALLGSTAERALRTTAEVCPVMLIPPAKTAKGRGQGRSRRQKVR